MVTHISGRDDRGQLVLIGALTLAFLMFGLVVIFSGAQFTETIHPAEASSSMSDTNQTDRQVVAGIEAYIEAEVIEDGDASGAENDVEDFITEMGATKAEQRSVNLFVDSSDVTIQEANLTDPGGSPQEDLLVEITWYYDSSEVTSERTYEREEEGVFAD